jgi:hypothetical protein
MQIMTSKTAQTDEQYCPDGDTHSGYLDEPLKPEETAKIAKTTTNALAVNRCREVGIPYSKVAGRITYTRRDIFDCHKQNRRVPRNNL